MHNPRVVVVVGIWFFVVHVGHLIGMSLLKQQCDSRFTLCDSATQDEREAMEARKQEYADIVAERRLHGIIAYMIGIAAAIAYGVVAQQHRYRATYYATLSFCIFGISFAVYQCIPKTMQSDPTPQDQIYRESAQLTSSEVYLSALLLALIAYVAAAKWMVKIDNTN